MAIFAFPLSFVGIFVAQLALIWGGYFYIRRFIRRKHPMVLAAWAALVLAGAEPMMPASVVRTIIQRSKGESILREVKQAKNTIEPLSSEAGDLRFALTYICDGKNYFMACRVIGVSLQAVPAASESNPPTISKREPAVPSDNIREITEKSIRLAELKHRIGKA